MGRGWRRSWAIALLAAVALPGALADTTHSPVRGDAHADYEADAGAILAHAQAYDPRFRLEVTFQRAFAYEVLVPHAGLVGTRGVAAPPAPTVLHVEQRGEGSFVLDPSQAASVLLVTDPRGFSTDALPVEAPRDPARLVVEAARPLADALDRPSLDPHDLQVGSQLRYTLEGLRVDQPLRAYAEGGILVIVARGVALVEDAAGAASHRAGREAAGERLVVLQAEGARALLEGTGMTAVLALPELRAGAGAEAVAALAGQEVGTEQEAGVAFSPRGLEVLGEAALAGSLLGSSSEGAMPGGNPYARAAAYEPLGARASAVGALLGGAVALAAVGLAGLLAGGKHGLFALLAPLYARLSSDHILDNGAREAIYRFVVDHPGANVSEVVKRFRLGWGATVYHLRVLERNHLIVASKQGRQVCYFQNGGRYHGQMGGISAVRNPNAAIVARAVLAHPGIQQREVCRVTGLAQPTVSWHLQRLEQAGLLRGEGSARKRYEALPTLAQLAERGLLQAQPATATVSPSTAAPTTVTTA